MANYTKTTIGKENRIELHEKLSLTGCRNQFKRTTARAMSHFFILIKKMKKSAEFFQVTARP